ncbi:MAG: hypothetical protein QW474_02845 [Candidatus Aenigmatarchaeota archaeon]
MVIYNEGATKISVNGYKINSIIDINFQNGLLIHVFPGRLSPNDIWIKFRNLNTKRSQIRTPKHIHWTVDILIKKFGDKNTTDQFLNSMLNRWLEIKPLKNRDKETIINNLILSKNKDFIKKYESLNNYGFFDIEFLTHLMELLMIQEKTNNPNAYMFKEVVNSILTSDDLYSIISAATHKGR